MNTASIKTSYFISSAGGLFGRIRPGNAAPSVIDTWFAKTVKKIMLGILVGLNQLTATLIAEFNTNKFPKAAKNDPINTHSGYPTSINVLSHTPAITKTEPIIHPIWLPYLSSIQLAGKAPIGCNIVNMSAFAVTIYLE